MGLAADHDIDQGSQINVYNTRGYLIESQGPSWLYGTASEHHVLYQYNLYNAQNAFLGAIQTETPYYQPSTKTPFQRSHYADPPFCTDDARCNMAYGLVLQNTTNVYIYSTGLYSFFNVWGQACLSGQPSCQKSIIYVDSLTKHVYLYAISTYGSIYMLNQEGYSMASSNSNTFCSTGIVDLNLF